MAANNSAKAAARSLLRINAERREAEESDKGLQIRRRAGAEKIERNLRMRLEAERREKEYRERLPAEQLLSRQVERFRELCKVEADLVARIESVSWDSGYEWIARCMIHLEAVRLVLRQFPVEVAAAVGVGR